MITEFAKRTGIPELEILGTSRARRITDARHVYRYILYLNGYSHSEIGRLCGCHHSTVTNGIKRAKGLIEAKDKAIMQLYNLTKDIKKKYL
ncbi:MAG: helix-turn-helix domain-containing protein [Dysgonamonadaceae bacterium]|jgi:chromosomal replication initiation ATPase DnaA|nr:helix-turn-helix domain-containing protein [Dysgonamonadaceae bacterium]